jgi:tetratricopeptide (TPR) repeat protein
MIEDGLTIPCHVTTNGSQYNKKVERVLEALPISLSISIDGATKETVERIRVNSHYETLISNLYRFREYARRRGTYMGLTYCLMRQNWHEFGDFLLFAEKLECEVFINTVVGPAHCSLYQLPPEDLARIVDEMERQDSSLQGKLRLNLQVWKEAIRKLRSSANESQAARLAKALEPYLCAPQEGHVGEARNLVNKRMYAEALEEVLKTPENHPYYYQSAVLCGHIRHLLGDLEGAERDLDRALTISRQSAEAFITRARLRLDQNRIKEGIEDALHAHELFNHDEVLEAEVCEVLSSLYSRQGKASEARTMLDRLRELESKNLKVRFLRGVVS